MKRCKITKLPPLEKQADVVLDEEESKQLVEILKNPPKPTPTLIRILHGIYKGKNINLERDKNNE